MDGSDNFDSSICSIFPKFIWRIIGDITNAKYGMRISEFWTDFLDCFLIKLNIIVLLFVDEEYDNFFKLRNHNI